MPYGYFFSNSVPFFLFCRSFFLFSNSIARRPLSLPSYSDQLTQYKSPAAAEAHPGRRRHGYDWKNRRIPAASLRNGTELTAISHELRKTGIPRGAAGFGSFAPAKRKTGRSLGKAPPSLGRKRLKNQTNKPIDVRYVNFIRLLPLIQLTK